MPNPTTPTLTTMPSPVTLPMPTMPGFFTNPTAPVSNPVTTPTTVTNPANTFPDPQQGGGMGWERAPAVCLRRRCTSLARPPDLVHRQDWHDGQGPAERHRLRVRHRRRRLLGHPADGQLLQPQHGAGPRFLRLQQLLPEEPIAGELRLRRRRHACQCQPK
jgi:hypothetical protein